MSAALRSDASTNYSALQHNGADSVLFNQGGFTSKILNVGASVASNALTVTIGATPLDFRNTTVGAAPVTRIISSTLSLTVPSSATLGTVSGQQARLMILALDNAGTVEPAIVNLSGGLNLDETALVSTTAISASATAANVIYSAVARTNVPYRVVGIVDITEVTAGTWSSAPTAVQGIGGQVLSALASLGYGQTWQTVTRASGTTYYNTTGRPIFVITQPVSTTQNPFLSVVVNGVTIFPSIALNTTNVGYVGPMCHFIVPPGGSYSITFSNSTLNVAELR